jgi:integrase
VGLAAARRASFEAAQTVFAGRDPIGEKRAKVEQVTMTFDGVAKLYIAAHEPTWKNAKHVQQWKNTLTTYAAPVFGKWSVQAVDTGAVMRVVEPLWLEKTETATRVRGRIESVLDYATSRGWRTGENPARWKGHIENLLPKAAKVAQVEHHAALPLAEMGGFMTSLHKQGGTAALALRFAILTAARTGEVIGARWSEIDMDSGTWTIPAERMKMGRLHRVPLTAAAKEVLTALLPTRAEGGDGFVFPGQKPKTGLSNMSMAAVLKRMKIADVTVHGFRSVFRQWAGDNTTIAREVIEASLAHAIGDSTERAYARNDLFDRRRELMEAWAAFCASTGKPSDNVVQIRALKAS